MSADNLYEYGIRFIIKYGATRIHISFQFKCKLLSYKTKSVQIQTSQILQITLIIESSVQDQLTLVSLYCIETDLCTKQTN